MLSLPLASMLIESLVVSRLIFSLMMVLSMKDSSMQTISLLAYRELKLVLNSSFPRNPETGLSDFAVQQKFIEVFMIRINDRCPVFGLSAFANDLLRCRHPCLVIVQE